MFFIPDSLERSVQQSPQSMGCRHKGHRLDVAGFKLETLIGNPGCGANPFAGIAFGSAGFQSCGNYSMVGDGVNTYIAAPTGNIYFRTQNNALTAMTIHPSIRRCQHHWQSNRDGNQELPH
jgi:hypothetical protein